MTTTMDDILETTDPVRIATGFVLTEGPTWHPSGFYYFADIRTGDLYTIRPGEQARWLRSTEGATARPSTCKDGWFNANPRAGV